ncbi:MAG: S9 family peptidase [Nitrospira sp.]
MPACSFSSGIALLQQRLMPRLCSSLRAAGHIARLTLLLVTVVVVAGCRSPEQRIIEQPPEEVTKDQSGRIALKAVASLPEVSGMALSPSGTSLALIQNIEDKTYVVTTRHDGKERRKLVETDNKTYSIRWCRWVNDERLIIGTSVANTAYGLGGPFRWLQTRLLAVNRDGSELKTDLIMPSNDIRDLRQEDVPQLQDRVIGSIPGDSRSVLIALDLKTTTYPEVYKLDVYTGRRELIEGSIYGIRHWMADRRGVVRLGMAVQGTMVHILVKPVGQNRWLTLKKYDALREPGGMLPLGFDEDPNVLFVEQNLDGRAAVYSINLSTPDLPPTLRASHAAYDVDGALIYAPWLKQVVGVQYHADASEKMYWNSEATELQTGIDLALPGRVNDIHSSSANGRRHIVVSSHATQPPQWYLYDVELGQLILMADGYPKLASKELVTPLPVALKARDGTVLHGYLTQPAHALQPGQLILLPHGGPASRDVMDFNYWTQFFASRGWTVLQVNFRGSSGYGEKFLQAGFKRWGLEMQDDLTDAARYAIGQGIADPERICIVGGSYGGYAALMGVVKTPELFRCAVSFAGVSDLRSLLEERRQFLGYELGAERQLGSLWSDRDRLKATSPVSHADRIRTPLLIVHGAEDRVVPVEQSREMVEALRTAGFKHMRYVELPNGDHYLSRQEDRLTFFREMERFLKVHLDGPRAENELRSSR